MNQSDYDALRWRIWTPAIGMAAIALGMGGGGVIGATWGFEAALIAMAIVGAIGVVMGFIATMVLDIVREGYDLEVDDGR